MREQAVQYGTEYYRKQVFMLDFDDGSETVHTKVVYTPYVTYKTRALVLTTGAIWGGNPVLRGRPSIWVAGLVIVPLVMEPFIRGVRWRWWGLI